MAHPADHDRIPKDQHSRHMLRVDQVCTLLSVGATTVRQLEREGAFPGSMKVRSALRIPRGAVTAYIKAKQAEREAARCDTARGES